MHAFSQVRYDSLYVSCYSVCWLSHEHHEHSPSGCDRTSHLCEAEPLALASLFSPLLTFYHDAYYLTPFRKPLRQNSTKISLPSLLRLSIACLHLPITNCPVYRYVMLLYSVFSIQSLFMPWNDSSSTTEDVETPPRPYTHASTGTRHQRCKKVHSTIRCGSLCDV